MTHLQRAGDGGSLAVNELDKWTPEGMMKKEKPLVSHDVAPTLLGEECDGILRKVHMSFHMKQGGTVGKVYYLWF